MKLNDTLITSPDDFARHFSFVEFWIKHDLFLRDLNPERIFYATDRQRQLYKVVEAWLKTEESETPEPPAYVFDETARAIIRTTVSEPDEAPCTLPVQINGDAVPAMKSVTGTNAARTAGILALYELAEKPLDITDLKTAFAEVDLDSDEIILQAGITKNFPSDLSKIRGKLTLKKIRICGTSPLETRILFNGKEAGTLKSGECAYVTAANGQFIELLDHRLENERYCLNLRCAENGKTYLEIYDKKQERVERQEDITSFALAGNEDYVYLYKKKIRSTRADSDKLYYLLDLGDEPLYIKSAGRHFIVLLNDGTVKSTDKTCERHGVFSTRVTPNGKIEYNDKRHGK